MIGSHGNGRVRELAGRNRLMKPVGPGTAGELRGARLTRIDQTPDGKGILWASGEYASGDPGDAAVLAAALTQQTLSWAAANGCTGVTIGDIQTAEAQP